MKKQFCPEEKNLPCFRIDGVLPSLNEYLAACGRNPKAGARLKKESMENVNFAIRKDLGGWKASKPLIIHYQFYEPNKRRDHDNVVSFTTKTVQDSLQKCGVIKNDGWSEIENYTHDFEVDTENPRIEVYLEEICCQE
jgi:Holliday junction resolvase RusA-like endonuclease